MVDAALVVPERPLRRSCPRVLAKLSTEARTSLGRRDIGETALFRTAYSEAGPKIVPLATSAGRRWKYRGAEGAVRRDGSRRGGYVAMMHSTSHDVFDGPPQVEALKGLAAFSLSARCVDRNTVVS